MTVTPYQGGSNPDFEIEYQSEDFPSHPGIRKDYLLATWEDLIWAAITIGRPSIAHVFQHGDASLHEAFFRMSILRMALEQPNNSWQLRRSDAFSALDPTEKGAVSYFLGMAVCKLFADARLGTTWLLHFDLFRDQLNAQLLGGRSRPDLIGKDNAGAWHVFETKGRSAAPSNEDKRKAKEQAKRLVLVDGQCCGLHVGSFTYFKSDELQFYWRDPEPEDSDKLTPLEINVSEDSWHAYYQYAFALSVDERGALAIPGDIFGREGIDATVEIHPMIRELLFERRWFEAHRRAAESESRLLEEGYQRDGIRVTAGPSWSRPARS